MVDDNSVPTIAFKGGSKATLSAHTHDGARMPFYNKRAEAIWRFREALDPNQEGGSPIALPPDQKLRGDLIAYRLNPKMLVQGKILIEDKNETIQRLGRSPDDGDAVIMSWSEGQALAIRRLKFAGRRPQVHLGYADLKRRR